MKGLKIKGAYLCQVSNNYKRKRQQIMEQQEVQTMAITNILIKDGKQISRKL